MKRLAGVLAAALLCLTGCEDLGGGGGGVGGGSGGSGGSGGNVGELDRPHSPAGQSWTVLVYMAADNDLEPFALGDLEEMMQVGSNNNFNLIVQVDRAAGYSSDPVGGLGDFTDTRRVRVQQGQLEQLQSLGEADMADPNVLADFVSWGIKTFPADHTAIIFWDHGGGWTGFGVDEGSGGKLLDLNQIASGLKQGRAGAGDKVFTLIGFDACLMATFEVAMAMAPHGEYLLASEETEPGHGWDWRAWATAANNPSSDAVAIGRSIIDGFRAQAAEARTADTITLSLIDLYRMGTLGKAVNSVVGAFGTGSASLTTAFGRAQDGAVKYGDNPDPGRAQNMLDLHHLVTLAAQAAGDQKLSAAQSELQTAISQVVVANTFGNARANSKGIAVYFPPNKNYYQAGYDALPSAEAWRAMVKAYFGISTGGGLGVPQFTDVDKIGQFGTIGNGVALIGTLSSGSESSIAQATAYYGIVSNQTFIVLGEQPASVGGGTVTGNWDTKVLALTQGTTVAFAYTSVQIVDASHLSLNLAFNYRRSSGAAPQDCLRQIVFTVDGSGEFTLTSDTYYVATGDVFGELTPVAGSELMPLLQVLDANGNLTVEEGGTPLVTSTGPNGQPEFAMGLEYRNINSGTNIFMINAAVNAGGDGDVVIGTGTLP